MKWQMVRRAAILGLGLAALGAGLGACGPDPVQPAAPAAKGAQWLAAPTITDIRADGQQWVVRGASDASARIRLIDQDGQAFGTDANAQGLFDLRLNASDGPRLFSIERVSGGHAARSEASLFVAPDGTAAVLHLGGASLPLGERAGFGLAAVDYDGRAVAVSGWGAAGQAVTVRLAGQNDVTNRVDATGRFTAAFNGVLPGSYRLDADSRAGSAARTIILTAPQATDSARASMTRLGALWRIERPLPGGGRQISLILLDAQNGAQNGGQSGGQNAAQSGVQNEGSQPQSLLPQDFGAPSQ